MVQDNVTGLIWEMKESKDNTKDYSNPHDADNSYTWCDTDPYTNGGYQGTCDNTNDTEDFINRLNTANFGGHADWRLPTITELLTLADLDQNNPAVDPIFASTAQSSRYWSSTTYWGYTPFYPDIALYVDFVNGANGTTGKSLGHYVRAVRGGLSPTQNRFVDNEDNTVTDTVTCLQWQKATMDTDGIAGSDWYTWQQALAASENLSLAGYGDWRLPDKNELNSLVDFIRVNPAIDRIFTSTTKYYGCWSSTTAYSVSNYAWTVDFSKGDGDVNGKSNVCQVRAVRGVQCRSVAPEEFPWELFLPAISGKHLQSVVDAVQSEINLT